MDTWPRQDAVYRFVGFALDPAHAALRGPDGVAIELRPKSYAALLHLVRNPGRLVTREALLDAVWPGVTVGDEAITQCVRDVRRALGETGPALLPTPPRRSYMLDAAMEVGPPETRVSPASVGGGGAGSFRPFAAGAGERARGDRPRAGGPAAGGGAPTGGGA
jgi:DNA-binding winged helix-turn-helix (wHTH) protein